jgi:hypothetical protein
MKRSEFVRLSILAAIGIAAAPALELAPKLPQLPAKCPRWVWLKVTDELLLDKEMFEHELNRVIGKFGGRGNLKNIDIGFHADDFVQNLKTVMLTFE